MNAAKKEVPSDSAEQHSQILRVSCLHDKDTDFSANTQEKLFSVESFDQCILDCINQPDPKKLWLSLWHEGEICCLFADSNLGKSIYAVQIAAQIASTGKKVIYFDFELSAKQFQKRYSQEEKNEYYEFGPNIFRACINPYAEEVGNLTVHIIPCIEELANSMEAEVLIIDNLTYLNNDTEKGDAAGRLMHSLMQLKRKYAWSVLVIAHTPKRDASRPITANDLAGSRKLFNFFDSVFAIGKSAKDESLRYIKQLKTRSGYFEYGEEHVITAKIEKVGAMLQFTTLGYDEEREHLKERTDKEHNELHAQIMELHKQGLSDREVARRLDINHVKVGRVLKKNEVVVQNGTAIRSVPSVTPQPIISPILRNGYGDCPF